MDIQLSEHFNFRKLFRFVFPSVIMMIFTSIYSVIDGFFVSNYVGKASFAAINLIMPVLMILAAVGFMLGAGGSALVARTLGEERLKKANETFSLIVYVCLGLGISLATVGIMFIKPISIMLGAEGELIELCSVYGRIILAALPFFMLQTMFQSFFVTAEKPNLGLLITVLSGVTNIVLDALFIIAFDWGIRGAASATAISQVVGGVIPFIYFARENKSALKLTKTKFDHKALIKATTNGSSEFVTNISMSVVTALYNFQLLKYKGEDGVAAYGVIMYVAFIFAAIFIGYSIGVAPIFGYNQGAENEKELKNVFGKSMTFIVVSGIFLTILSYVLSRPLSMLFVGYDKALMELTTHAFQLYSLSFFMCGIGIFGSALFTALNNGMISAIISFLRTFAFQALAITIMPAIWGIEGVWYAIIVAEAFSAVVAMAFILKYKKVYKY